MQSYIKSLRCNCSITKRAYIGHFTTLAPIFHEPGGAMKPQNRCNRWL